MKKRLSVFCAIMLLAAMLIMPAESLAASFSAAKAAIRVSGATYRLGSTGTKWKSKLGTCTRKKYDGCTAGTDSYMYTFKKKGVKVETLMNKTGGSEQIITFVLSKSSVGTSLGLKVGNTLENMEDKYGKDYKKSGAAYTYEAGKYSMIVRYNAKGTIKSITMMKDC